MRRPGLRIWGLLHEVLHHPRRGLPAGVDAPRPVAIARTKAFKIDGKVFLNGRLHESIEWIACLREEEQRS